MAITAKQVLDLLDKRPRIVQEVALGLEEGKEIAARYGISEADWAEIEASEAFQRELSGIRADMERTGKSFRVTAGVMSRELMKIIFSEATRADTDLKVKTEVLKTLARYADWEPKQTAQVEAGPGFSISISVPTAPLVDNCDDVVDVDGVEDIEPAESGLVVTFGTKEKTDVLDDERLDDDCGSDAGNSGGTDGTRALADHDMGVVVPALPSLRIDDPQGIQPECRLLSNDPRFATGG